MVREVDCRCDRTLAVDCGVFAEEVDFPGAEWVEVMLDPFSFTGYQSIIVSEIEGTFCHGVTLGL